MKQLFVMVHKRNAIIERKQGGIEIASATFDVWCKRKAAFTAGLDRKVMRMKNFRVVFIDEYEAVVWPQFLAALLNMGTARTLIIGGDVQQRSGVANTCFAGTTWIDNGGMGRVVDRSRCDYSPQPL